MILVRRTIRVGPFGRGLHDLTHQLADFVRAAGVHTGLCHVFLQHTSASLVVQENADPDVLHDLETWFARAVPDGEAHYRHSAEGPDDMPGHIRAALTQTSLSLPVSGHALDLGTWQAVYLYEHRLHPHMRRLVLTAHGSPEAS